MGNALHRSNGDIDEALRLRPGEDHGPPPTSDPDFFVGKADPWGVPLRASIFPGIAEHAAFVATAVVSPVIRMNAAGGGLIDFLLACLYMVVVFRMDQREVKRARYDAAKKSRTDQALQVGALIDAPSIIEAVKSAKHAPPEPSEEEREIEAEAPFWKRRLLRLVIMMSATGLALLLRRLCGVYWDGWVLVVVFMLLEDLIGDLCEACLGWFKNVIKKRRRAKWITA
jgi:hypothetical protein